MSRDRILANIGAFIATLLMLCAFCAFCAITRASEKWHMALTTDAIVFERDGKGGWISRLATVDKFSDGLIVACFAEPREAFAQCFVMLTENPKETVVVRVRLLGEAKT